MKEGYWINYGNGKVFPIDEHERWLRRADNAALLGVPKKVQKTLEKFEPVDDREKFMLTVFGNAPAMRVRGHGPVWAFEFSSDSVRKPLDAIYSFCKDRAGDYTHLVINNFAKNDSVSMTWKDFRERYESDDTIIRESIMGGAKKMKPLPKFREFFKDCFR